MVAGLKSMDYETPLAVLDLFPLEYRRLRGDLILTYALFEKGLANRFFAIGPANTRRGHDVSAVPKGVKLPSALFRLCGPIPTAEAKANFTRLQGIYSFQRCNRATDARIVNVLLASLRQQKALSSAHVQSTTQLIALSSDCAAIHLRLLKPSCCARGTCTCPARPPQRNRLCAATYVTKWKFSDDELGLVSQWVYDRIIGVKCKWSLKSYNREFLPPRYPQNPTYRGLYVR
ncbi:hypothetical protein CLF_108990 [Clonorchis sinensis]|uniref:Uncharacterized protein n=1 Tax=Clonorchis sinensis TaxID=79923 RepID=G7YS53_CLOSI|nr:hypothetical protein CLF_108990 [Clonorchis sinensis]